MAELPLLDITDLRSPSPLAQADVAGRIDRALQDHGAFHAVGHGIPLRIPRGGFAQCRQLFALPASARQSLRADLDGPAHGRGFAEAALPGEGLQPDRYVLGADLPPAHHLVAAGTPGYGPNRWPPLHAFRDAVTVWHRAALDVTELVYSALAVAAGLAPDHLVAHQQCSLVSMRLDRFVPDGPEAATGWQEHPHGLALSMVGSTVRHQLHAGSRPTDTSVVPGQVLVRAGSVLEAMSDGRYRAPLERWCLGPDPVMVMTLTNDLDFDTPLGCLRPPGAGRAAATATVGEFVAGRRTAGSLAG